MTHAEFSITATGRRNAAAEGHEVHVLGFRAAGSSRFLISPDGLPGGWQIFPNIDRGVLGYQKFGLRGTEGSFPLAGGERGRIALLRHPWSGIAEIRFGDLTHDVDLYSSIHDVIFVDLPSGQITPGDRALLDRIELLVVRDESPTVERGSEMAGVGELLIRATGVATSQSNGTDVVVLRVEPMGYGVPLDLSHYTGPDQSWQAMGEVNLESGSWPTGIVSKKGELRIGCEDSGVIFLLRYPDAGYVEVSYGAVSVRLDLFSPTPSLLEIDVRNLASLIEAGKLTEEGDDSERALSLSHKPRRERFAQLMAGFDTRKPVAIYVPRWHGVAASTRALFDQALPIPESHDGHPDDITTDDINEYASILVDAGVRHLVVSGGDVFNLKIIEAATRLAPDFRVDLLWHSNFLQMNEPHDWNLLRHWLAALQDGTVTRIAVVKEGLERWFARIGIASIFIPNVVPFDVASASATDVDDVVGIWLSGSSSYRKLPHAMLMALRQVPNVALMGSGFDTQSQRMIQDLRLPFRELSMKPLPQAQLHKRMRRTGLSLYVTISECSPMLPLESFALGVPCLVGPSSHLFVRSKVLSEALIVERPHSPTAIAEKVIDGLARRQELFDAYVDYYHDELKLAHEGVARLVA